MWVCQPSRRGTVPAMRAMCGIQRDCQHFCVSLSLLPGQLENTSGGGAGITGRGERPHQQPWVCRGLQPPHQCLGSLRVCPAEAHPPRVSFPECPAGGSELVHFPIGLRAPGSLQGPAPACRLHPGFAHQGLRVPTCHASPCGQSEHTVTLSILARPGV